MVELAELRRAARGIFDEALKGANAGAAVRGAVRLKGSGIEVVDTSFDPSGGSERVYAVAIGKASRPMAVALTEVLGGRLKGGVITAPPVTEIDGGRVRNDSASDPHADLSLPACWREFEGGHPLPNRASMDAARAAFELLGRADAERALVIFLISGGGSAMMEWPRDERITLEELREANRALVNCGAGIGEINAVRRAFSAVKGGGLALRAPRCEQVSLIVSDTGAGEEDAVASGPTFPTRAGAPDPVSVIARHGLEKSLPESVLRAIAGASAQAESGPAAASRRHFVLLDNESAMESAVETARSLGFAVEVAREVVEQPIAEGPSLLLRRLMDLRRRTADTARVACLISGGEFSCPVRGEGVGGRNSETALRWAIELDALAANEAGRTNIVGLSAGTDGIDGNSPAAGAVADQTTLARARALNLDAGRFLSESDSYSFFRALCDAIMTGPTGTNVRDLRVLLTG